MSDIEAVLFVVIVALVVALAMLVAGWICTGLTASPSSSLSVHNPFCRLSLPFHDAIGDIAAFNWSSALSGCSSSSGISYAASTSRWSRSALSTRLSRGQRACWITVH
jgi:hypothetical protein